MFTSLRKFVELHPEAINQFALVNWGGRQYAEGVTGVNYFDKVIVKSATEGFAKKGDCMKALTPELRKSMTRQIKGRPNEGYGRVGATWQKLKAFRISEILEIAKKKGFNWGYASLYCRKIVDGKVVCLAD